MKKTKLAEAQIAFVLKQAEDGVAVAEVCRKAGISDVLQLAQEICRTHALGDEAAPAVADPSLDKAMLQDVLSKKL